jgi:hypothetical protein
MRIGIDFDNTIVSYDKLFHKVAIEKQFVPPNTPSNKLAVREYLRRTDKEAIWTELQGYVYGARIGEASAFPGVVEFIQRAGDAGHILAIISHKTKYPFLGAKYDLHAAAHLWVKRNLSIGATSLIPADHVFFVSTKEEKIALVKKFACDVFIDDLPEILLSPAFPVASRRFLFDPEGHHGKADFPNCFVFRSWIDIQGILSA